METKPQLVARGSSYFIQHKRYICIVRSMDSTLRKATKVPPTHPVASVCPKTVLLLCQLISLPTSTSSSFQTFSEPTTFGLILKKFSLTRKCQSGVFWRSKSVNLFPKTLTSWRSPLGRTNPQVFRRKNRKICKHWKRVS